MESNIWLNRGADRKLIQPSRHAIHFTILAVAMLVAAVIGWQRTAVSNQAAGSVSPAVHPARERNVLVPQDIQAAQHSTNTSTTKNVDISPPPDVHVSPTIGTVSTRSEPVIYTVEVGDNVTALAERYGISVDTIRWANGLDDVDLLVSGQQLKILPVSGILHTVNDGDTLQSIAAAYGVDISAIVTFNQISDPDKLSIGTQLIVPGGRLPEPVRVEPSARGSTRPSLQLESRSSNDSVATSVTHSSQTAEAAAPAVQAAPPPSAGAGDIISAAMQYVGAPYVFGGSTPSGFDCSGFVQYVFNSQGRSISRDLWGMLQSGAPVSRGDLQPGDLVFFANTYMPGLSHVGIYIGGGRMVHAQSERTGVTVTSLGESYWSSRYYAARRP